MTVVRSHPCLSLSLQAPGVTEFHGGILVTDLGHATSNQPAPVSRLFSPSTVQDSLVKGEQVPVPAISSECPCGWDGWDFVSGLSQPTPGLGTPPAGRPRIEPGFAGAQRGLPSLPLARAGKMPGVGQGKAQVQKRSRCAAAWGSKLGDTTCDLPPRPGPEQPVLTQKRGRGTEEPLSMVSRGLRPGVPAAPEAALPVSESVVTPDSLLALSSVSPLPVWAFC